MKSLSHQFLDFCRSKPADEAYTGGDSNICALAQFGFKGVTSGNCELFGIPDSVYRAAVPVANRHRAPRTFGALASRLEAELAE